MINKKDFGTIEMPPQVLPVIAEADVVIAGGGTSGFVAAIASARAGNHTVLIEKEGYLGGALTGTYCTDPGYFGDSEGHQIIRGIGWEVMENMEQLGAAILDREQWKVQMFPETIKKVALDMVIEAGVELYLHSWASNLLVDNGTIKSIIIQNKSGQEAINGKVFVDATSDADIAFLSGAQIEILPPDRLLQTSIDLTVCNVNPKKVIRWAHDNEDEILAGEIPEIKEDYPGINPTFGFVIPGKDTEILPGKGGIRHKGPMPTVKLLIHHNISRIQGSVEIDGTNVQDLTHAEIEGRKKAMAHLSYLKEKVPGFEDAIVIGASHIGVRETRRIIGDYVMRLKDLLGNARFSDVIALNCRALDLHLKDDVFELSFLEGNHDIPLRALIPKGIENLFVAGRCISSDHEANASIRGAATCLATGHAAGTAAALAARGNGKTRDLNVIKLQKILKDQNAIISTD